MMKQQILRSKLILVFSVICMVNALGQSINTKTERELSGDVLKSIERLNYYWTKEENLDSLFAFLHPDMVVLADGDSKRHQGIEAVLKSYQQFLGACNVVDFKMSDPYVGLFNENQTALVAYYADLKYINSQNDTIRFEGQEIYTLIRQNGKWKAIGQAFLENK